VLSVLILLGMMDKFIEERYVLELCALKNGGIILRLHLQMVGKIYTQTSVPTQEIGNYLLKNWRTRGHHLHSLIINNHLICKIQQVHVRGFQKKPCLSLFTLRSSSQIMFLKLNVSCLVYIKLVCCIDMHEICKEL
jgi:hypothetical protein